MRITPRLVTLLFALVSFSLSCGQTTTGIKVDGGTDGTIAGCGALGSACCGTACTTGACVGGVCTSGGGSTESIANGGFESGTGSTACGANAFHRTSWIGTGSAGQTSGCGWTGPDVTVILGYPDGVTAGTISQSFAATTGPGTLTYKQGSYQAGACSYTVTFGPSNTVVPVSSQYATQPIA